VTEVAYDRIGRGYGEVRRPDPRIAARIDTALGGARSVLNVGAGTGSYEPADHEVTAVEPSELMIAQRPPGSAPVVKASAEELPFEDDSFDAAMAIITVHHWTDLHTGLAEMVRVARHRIVILTFDPAPLAELWLVHEYFPQALEIHGDAMPPIDELVTMLPNASVEPVPVPRLCQDGFFCALGTGPRCISIRRCAAPALHGT
jgi:SAM-dependent methyltransferase